MLFKISCCAFNFKGLDLDEKMKLVKNMGFDIIDLACKSGEELSQETIFDKPVEYGTEIKEKSNKYSLKLDELFVCTILDKDKDMDVTTNDINTQKKILSKFDKICIFAENAGFNSVLIVPLSPNKEMEASIAWENTVKILKELADIAIKHNLILNIEPVDFSLLKTPQLACKMAEEVAKIGFTLDYSHYISVGFTQDEIYPMHKYMNHMHIRQAKVGSRQEPIETGTIDFSKITQLLLNDDFKGNLAMEHIDHIEPYKLVNSVVRQNAEQAARLKYIAEHKQVKQLKDQGR